MRGVGVPSGVRGEDKVGRAPEGRVCLEGSGLEHVEGCASEMAAHQCLGKRSFVDQPTARGY